MSIAAIFPELILFTGALTILMLNVFLGNKIKNVSHIAFFGAMLFSIVSLAAIIISYGSSYVTFGGMFQSNNFTSFVKIITVLLLVFVIFMSSDFLESEKKISSEFVALMMIATSGAMFLISSRDLLPFYLALELQSLSLYILAAIKRDSKKSSESGMKYFLLGSVSSAIMLLGISMVYGFSGSTSFSEIFNTANQTELSVGTLLGMVLILVAVLFKVSAVPFHMWTPDVYEGSATIVTAFFASVIKFMSVIVMMYIYVGIVEIWPSTNQILICVAILSLLVGSLGAIKQTNLKRLLAYSSIGHVGFVLAGLSAASLEAVQYSILYMVIYGTLSLGSFAFLILLKYKGKATDSDTQNDKIYQLSSISGIAKSNPVIALCLAILMFSMAGIPPLAGFFAKFYILLAIVKKELYFLAVIAVLTSVISAFYYLRIVKIIYFDDLNKDNQTKIDPSNNSVITLVMMALVNLLALIYLTPLTSIIANFN